MSRVTAASTMRVQTRMRVTVVPHDPRDVRTMPDNTLRILRHLLESDGRIPPDLLPRRHPGEADRDTGIHEQQLSLDEQLSLDDYAGTIRWASRAQWCDRVVPWMLERHDDVRQRIGPARATVLACARAEAQYANHSSGRNCVARADVVARLIGKDVRTVQRCRRVLRELGVYRVVRVGRMLKEPEVRRCGRLGGQREGYNYSRQRGLANVAACVVPKEWFDAHKPRLTPRVPVDKPACPAVDKTASDLRFVTPPKRLGTPGLSRARPLGSSQPTTLAARGEAELAALAAAPKKRIRPPKRRSRPALTAETAATRAAAVELVRLVPWLAGVAPGRIAQQLRPFVRAGWTPFDFVDAFDVRQHRMSWSTPTRARLRTGPEHAYGLLRSYLSDLDPQADHPRPELLQLREARPAWCGHCDRTTRMRDWFGPGAPRMCPECHPARVAP